MRSHHQQIETRRRRRSLTDELASKASSVSTSRSWNAEIAETRVKRLQQEHTAYENKIMNPQQASALEVDNMVRSTSKRNVSGGEVNCGPAIVSRSETHVLLRTSEWGVSGMTRIFFPSFHMPFGGCLCSFGSCLSLLTQFS